MTEPVIQDDQRSADHPHDVVVIGGGAAGLTAALQLGRARRSVVVIDSGEPRNAPAAHVHGFLGHEGIAPAELLARGHAEVRGYGVEIWAGRVHTVDRTDTGFQATLTDGRTVQARRVLLATGLTDLLPDIPGVRAQWGRGVLHCPYCHGWEVRDQRIVVIATGPGGAHQAGLFRQLTEQVTVVVHEGTGPDHHERVRLAARGVQVLPGPVEQVVVDADQVSGVRLANGTVVPADAVVVAPRMVARAELVHSLGLTAVPDPAGRGEVIPTDASGATAVAGVFVAGNATNVAQQVLAAAADGGWVGAAINADLVAEDTTAAVAALPADVEWDHRYAEQIWSGGPNGVLVDELTGHQPGRALDVGCGEGGDAIWLAQRGWQVTAVDVSQVALDRGRAAAAGAGVEVDWRKVDVTTEPLGSYDLVSLHYPALQHGADHATERALLAAVAPGGTLLVVGHAFGDLAHTHTHTHAHSRDFDPADYVQPPDVADLLDDDWEVLVDETRPRTGEPAEISPHTHDVVLRACRRR
ncbi:bifunctional NAD(P)/FAD-dependent oxidoreductase/class I SAM-dependent methyltransferase [Rhodococcus sp. X156]|uniref:bifunctional NAD(P)/FAD-dependent oxidoreductase/class I SAM-dependent methyltransferase n=1 Tax=Rhodococcus sp. X156 TaxID=2499145 RepID=UPI000FDA76F5|nr:bifunctional NAD(P)/FAD-dependent oxidoreductase/class I SAM-dependent methyltransferase [Rhodococcus sp. X156]